MKYMVLVFSCCLFFSCSDSFVNHKLQSERIGDCSGISASVKITANINGERYEFVSCIDDGFDGKNYSLIRTGDSIIVQFPKTAAANKVAYKIILDVDTKPAYHHIILDGRELNVNPAQQ